MKSNPNLSGQPVGPDELSARVYNHNAPYDQDIDNLFCWESIDETRPLSSLATSFTARRNARTHTEAVLMGRPDPQQRREVRTTIAPVEIIESTEQTDPEYPHSS